MDALAGNQMRAPYRARLGMIADIVGCSVENFLDGSVSVELDDTAEMLRLWSAIRTGEGRRVALNAMRTIVEAQGSGDFR